MDQVFYEVADVSRHHLIDAGFDPAEVNDATMQRIADEMAEAYYAEAFWRDLCEIAEEFGIPKTAAGAVRHQPAY